MHKETHGKLEDTTRASGDTHVIAKFQINCRQRDQLLCESSARQGSGLPLAIILGSPWCMSLLNDPEAFACACPMGFASSISAQAQLNIHEYIYSK